MALKQYTFVDYATQGYLALVGLIVLCLHGQALPDWRLLLAAHGVCMGLIHALIRTGAAHPGNRLVDFLRHSHPALLYAGLYRETAALNHLVVPGFLDPFIRLIRPGTKVNSPAITSAPVNVKIMVRRWPVTS